MLQAATCFLHVCFLVSQARTAHGIFGESDSTQARQSAKPEVCADVVLRLVASALMCLPTALPLAQLHCWRLKMRLLCCRRENNGFDPNVTIVPK